MAKSEQPLYPKLSSIYNKIMQLAIAIALIIFLLNILLFNHQKNSSIIEQHFAELGDEYSAQAAMAVSVLFAKNDKQGLQAYIDEMSASQLIDALHFYDPTGQLLFHSKSAQSMRALYGIEQQKMNKSEQFIPFVTEVRDGVSPGHVQGYLRLTLEKKHLVDQLQLSNDQSSEMYRLMLVLAGLVGFLLTRGLNRFSRQGYRVGKSNEETHNY